MKEYPVHKTKILNVFIWALTWKPFNFITAIRLENYLFLFKKVSKIVVYFSSSRLHNVIISTP